MKTKQPISKAEAINRLVNRYKEQCTHNPLTNRVSMFNYIATNLESVMKLGLLADYSKP